jgi:hypothetical protein
MGFLKADGYLLKDSANADQAEVLDGIRCLKEFIYSKKDKNALTIKAYNFFHFGCNEKTRPDLSGLKQFSLLTPHSKIL